MRLSFMLQRIRSHLLTLAPCTTPSLSHPHRAPACAPPPPSPAHSPPATQRHRIPAHRPPRPPCSSCATVLSLSPPPLSPSGRQHVAHLSSALQPATFSSTPKPHPTLFRDPVHRAPTHPPLMHYSSAPPPSPPQYEGLLGTKPSWKEARSIRAKRSIHFNNFIRKETRTIEERKSMEEENKN
ncbi:leucine-rich repeat extensin-like protein 3 [Diaphorina citri]|uniref:Leucine-rich repeat extensin-like protein 3 n=1 Tax=Diaphorina citri TaxID=121845 RepID=A0A1S3DUN0_DIACI|nr:leucine-rich repeat extensin-like protein 3 [Diaphorina citri]